MSRCLRKASIFFVSPGTTRNSRGIVSSSSSCDRRRVVITGAGTVTPLGGPGLKETFEKVAAGQSGVGRLQDTTPDESYEDLSPYADLPSQVAARVPFALKQKAIEFCNNDKAFSLAMKYADYAANEAISDAKWNPTLDHDKFRTGVCVGNGMVDLDYIAAAYNLMASGKLKKVSPYFIPRVLANIGAGHIAIRHGFRGPNHAVSTACATGSHAIGDAYNFIANNDADVMLAGGTDTCLNPLSMVGFSRARALSTKYNDCPAKASRPFDRDRDGFVMAEGAGVVVLEELEHALKRQASIYCEVVGYGVSGDADHITAGLKDGSGALLAIRGAFRNLRHLPNYTDYLWLINAHATSTPRGDCAEMTAVRRFLQDCPVRFSPQGPYVTANKSNLGHLIGAAGTVEAAFSAMSLKTNVIPGTLNLDNPEEGIGEGVRILDKTITDCRPQGYRRLVLKNSFGFGGTNVSLVLADYIDSDS